MPTSKARFSIILIPNNGRLLINKGSMAQCMAQASEAPIPKASQLILIFTKGIKVSKKQHCCKIFENCTGCLPLPYKEEIMTKKGLFYIGFFAVLIIGFYFGVRGFLPKNKAIISSVKPFSFINQDGNRVTEKDMVGKVYVAAFFFTTCTSICPPMNNNLKKVYEKYKNEKDFFILSHTCMPEIDSAAVLKAFSDKMNVDTKKWIFLTGRKDSLYNMARTSYTIDDPQKVLTKIEDDFIHTQHWALVDKNGDVRKIYDGLKKAEVEQLIKDIPKYLNEK